ncbi:hypothetical protein Tco_1548425 [Tanacetum coccineum]
MENEHELSYETLTRVYLGSDEHYKGVVAEVEYLEPGFELQGAKMVEMGSYGRKVLMPYGFERGYGWCEFEWRYKGAIYSQLEMRRLRKPWVLLLTPIVPKGTSVPHPPSPRSAQIQELMAQAKPSYPDINQLTTLMVTSLKPELAKLLASHDFASCLPTELKELPSKVTELKIPSKLETFTSTISNLSSHVAKLKNIQWELPAEFLVLPHLVSSVQEKLKTLDSLLSLLKKVTYTLNRFATLVENASRATTMGVPSVDKATSSPAEGGGGKDADTNLKNELVNLLGIDIVTQYYNKKLIYEKYYKKMKKRRQSSKNINCDVLTKKGPISLKVIKEAQVIKFNIEKSFEMFEVPSASALQVLRRLGIGSIFTSGYASGQKMSKALGWSVSLACVDKFQEKNCLMSKGIKQSLLEKMLLKSAEKNIRFSSKDCTWDKYFSE